MGLVLAWAVLAKSLPFALSRTHPDLALRLDPANPAALIAKAERLRDRLLRLSPRVTSPLEGNEDSVTATVDGIGEDGTGSDPDLRRALLRRQIRMLAANAFVKDPLNAEAYRLLAETEEDPEQKRALMKEAVHRSRRESVALFWLLNDALERRDFNEALNYADILLQTNPELSKHLVKYVWLVASDPQGLAAFSRTLAKKPAWRKQVFEDIPDTVSWTDLPLRLMIALKEDSAPPSAAELRPYLDLLIRQDRLDFAYNVWIKFLPAPEAVHLNLLTNANFQHPPSGLPFDWRTAPGLNAIADFTQAHKGDLGAFRVTAGTGRVRFPELSQVLLLPPGRYRLNGRFRGRLEAERGLRWQLSCASGGHNMIAQTNMLERHAPQWHGFTLEADVPRLRECTGQILRLYHDARSASEEFMSGEIFFTSLQLSQIPNSVAASE